MSGHLYIISNQAWPTYIKFGSTENLNKRLQQYQTADPHRGYILEHSVYHPEYIKAEKKLKDLLKPFAKRIKNEWYEIDLNMARSKLNEILENFEENS